MKLQINKSELFERIKLNRNRFLDGDYYRMPYIFEAATGDWPGDKEGRLLLALVSHYKISGEKPPFMDEMVQHLPKVLNEKQYFGEIAGEIIIEQQLSGHSWMLRGLCEYYEQFADEYAKQLIDAITENLFLPTMGQYKTYPVNREEVDEGAVGGFETQQDGVWRLSSDIGCAFMAIDGLSHVYAITGDVRVKALLDEMIGVYVAIDKSMLRAQTHCTLTAARGMMRMYDKTKDARYLEDAKSIYDLYVNGGGMTLTYQNLNWWRRPDTWTEPCAIVDSLMLALELYKVTGAEEYRTIAARVYFNGFATAQRDNGGAGTDTLICEGSPWNYLASQMYEAHFCCSMRLAEGLWYIHENIDLLYAELDGAVTRQKNGTYADGDLMYAEVEGGAEAYAEKFVEVDGHRLSPIVKYYRVPREIFEASRQRIVFD